MDTSETYIKMCEKATEIQELRGGNPEIKRLSEPHYKKGWDGDFQPNDFFESRPGEDDVWLPRQDQLQTMIGRTDYAATMAVLFYQWLMSHANDYSTDWSMEQLWMAFVMKEKYGKGWNGTDWILQ